MKRRLIALFMCLCMCLTMLQAAVLAEDVPSEEAQWELISDAYTFAFPLVLMDWTMKAATNTESADLAGHAPVNQLIHAQKLADADTKMVVTPNVDTVYTQAWLNLSEEPMIYVMPSSDRYFQIQMLDAWTNTVTVLGEAGTYMLARTDWNGSVPEGVIRIDSPTDMVWLIGRVLIDGEADMPNVRAIQNEMRLLPLSAYLSGDAYVPAPGQVEEEYNVVPIEALLSMSPQTFFDAANRLMESNPPSAADAEILNSFRPLGIGPGFTFDVTLLQGDVKANWTHMLQSLRPALVRAGAQYQVALGGWTFYGAPIGDFGTAYDYRALIALGGLGANPVDVAIYMKTDIDTAGQELQGDKRYLLHFDSMPPIMEGGFWSATVYGSDDFLIENPISRYCINDRSDFIVNDDGTLDILLSSDAPEKQSNWLPVGKDSFHLFLRIYLPDMNAVYTDWTAPTVTLLADK